MGEMRRHRGPRPDEVGLTGTFTVVEARAKGVALRQLKAPKMLIPTPGVRCHTALLTVAQRAHAFALVLPDDVVFSHLTAARLHGLALPRGLERESSIDVMRRSAKARIDRAGVVSHRGLERRAVETVAGLPVTSVADTWCDIIAKHDRRLTLPDAVMMGDAAVELIRRTAPRVDEWSGRLVFDVPELHPEVPPASPQWWSDPANTGIWRLVETVAERERFRGKRLADAALPLLRPRVWSPMESRSRLVIVDGGIREPRLNASVRDSTGTIVVIGDHVWDEEEVVGDYNGVSAHNGMDSRVRDNRRRLGLEDEGWFFLEIYHDDVMTRDGRRALLRRLHRGLTRRQVPRR